ncbi:MAG: tRNA (adenosine(37)-N6)-threonylcarbamoyltransferase complex dimerization subunit type 1 TsaB [Betaproteobacteria bacterium]
MKLLAFDSSTRWVTVGCGDASAFLARTEDVGNRHSERLLPMIHSLLAEAGLTLNTLDGIAYGAGPGAFTGVRIACGVAQGLALGAGRPLVPVGTLEVIAQMAWHAHGATSVVACLDARMREVYVASYQRLDNRWREHQAPQVVRPQTLLAPLGPGPWFGAGDGFASYPDLALQMDLAAHDAAVRPDARAIAELAAPRFAAGEAVDAADARPLYVRHRVALTTAERAAGATL